MAACRAKKARQSKGISAWARIDREKMPRAAAVNARASALNLPEAKRRNTTGCRKAKRIKLKARLRKNIFQKVDEKSLKNWGRSWPANDFVRDWKAAVARETPIKLTVKPWRLLAK